MAIFDLLAYWTAAVLIPLYSTPFPCFLFLLARLKLPWILFFLSADENILRQFQLVLPTNFAVYRPNLLALDFSSNDPIGSRSNGGHLENSSINNRRTAIAFIPLSSLFSRGETLFLFPLIIILELNFNPEIILRQLKNLSKPNFLVASTKLFRDNFKTCLSQISLSSQRNYSKTFSKLVFAKNSALQSQPSRSPLLTKWSIGSRSTGGHLEISSINNQRTARVFIRFLAYFPEANLSSTSLPSIFWKYSKTFHQHPKIFKDFFACKNVLAANHQQPENIQRLFRLQIVLAANHQLYPGNIQRLFGQQQPAAAINSSNQQQQSTAATSSSNQQQQPAAAINSRNQYQQSTAATSSSNQQQQPVSAINSSN